MPRGDVELCHAALDNGPLTTGAVAKLVGSSVQTTSANLHYLLKQERVKRTQYHKTGPLAAGPQVVWQWEQC